MRTAIKFIGSVDGAAVAALDVSEAEIAVAQMADGPVWWPHVAASGFKGGLANKFWDRLSETDVLVNGATDVIARIAADGSGAAGYSLNNVNQAVVGSFDSTGSFTVGVVTIGGVAFGSKSNPTVNDAWWVVSQNVAGADFGKLRCKVGNITGSYTPYSGPDMQNTKTRHYLVLVYNRAAQTATLRVDGVQVNQITGISLTAPILGEVAIGIFNAASSASFRAGASYAEPILFERALSGSDLTALEDMLAEKVA